MPDPVFLLQIVHAQTGAVAQLPAGGPLERDFRQALRASLQKQGVGLLKTESQVLDALDLALNEVVGGLKKETRRLA